MAYCAARLFRDSPDELLRKSSGAFHKPGAQAARANVDPLRYAAHQRVHFAQVGRKGPVCPDVGVADLISEHFRFFTDSAFARHEKHLLHRVSSGGRKHPPGFIPFPTIRKTAMHSEQTILYHSFLGLASDFLRLPGFFCGFLRAVPAFSARTSDQNPINPVIPQAQAMRRPLRTGAHGRCTRCRWL